MEDITLSIDDTEFYKGTSFYVAGAWNNTTKYVNNSSRIDIVYYNGNSYAALKDNTNVRPDSNTSTWMLVAKAGDAGTIEIGTVETVAAGQKATVTNVGNSHNARLNFKIPKGEDGVTEITNLSELENYIYYGVRRRVDQNSSSVWERIGSSIGKVANATKDGSSVQNDFDSIYPWSDIITCNLDPSTNEIKAFIGDPTFSFDGSNGEVMTRIPEFYWKRYVKDGYEYILISRYHLADFVKSTEFFIGRYTSSYDGTKLHSISGAFSEVSKNISWFRSNSKSVGEKWCQLDYHYFLLRMLYLVEYADYNSQSKLGRGNTEFRTSDADKALVAENGVNRIIVSTNVANYFVVGQYIGIGSGNSCWNNNIAINRKILRKENYSSGSITGVAVYFDGAAVNIATSNVLHSIPQPSGECNSLGMKSGCLSNDGKHGIIYRGIENIFGNMFQFLDGINLKDYQAYICMNPEEYASDVFAGAYKSLGYSCFKPLEGSTNTYRDGYCKAVGYDKLNPLFALPTDVGGSNSTYMCDFSTINNGNKIAFVGGYYNYNTQAGLWYMSMHHTSSTTHIDVGGRLLI